MRENGKTSSYAAAESSLYFGAVLLAVLLFFLFRWMLMIRTGLLGQGFLSVPLLLYLTAFLLSVCLMPAVIQRLIMIRMERDHAADAVRLFRTLCLYVTVLGAGFSVFFWFLGGFLGSASDRQFSVYALRYTGFLLWALGYLGVLRGYYIGRGSIVPVAISIVTEQFFSGIFGIFCSAWFLRYGQKAVLIYQEGSYLAAYGAMSAVLSMLAGALLSLLLLRISAALSGGVLAGANAGRRLESLDSLRASIERCVIPVFLCVLLMCVTGVADELIYGHRMANLYPDSALRVYQVGSLSIAFCCLFLPVLGTSGLSFGLISALREAVQRRDRRRIGRELQATGKLAFLFSLFFCLVFWALSEPFSNLLFSGEDLSLLRRLLCYGAPFAVAASLGWNRAAALFGLGHYTEPLMHAIVASLIHLCLLFLLLYVFRLEAFASLFAFGAGNLVFFGLCSLSLAHCVKRRPHMIKNWVLPILITFSVAVLLRLFWSLCRAVLSEALLSGRFVSGLIFLVSAFAGFLIWRFLLMLSGALKKEELRAMPLFGRLSERWRDR